MCIGHYSANLVTPTLPAAPTAEDRRLVHDYERDE